MQNFVHVKLWNLGPSKSLTLSKFGDFSHYFGWYVLTWRTWYKLRMLCDCSEQQLHPGSYWWQWISHHIARSPWWFQARPSAHWRYCRPQSWSSSVRRGRWSRVVVQRCTVHSDWAEATADVQPAAGLSTSVSRTVRQRYVIRQFITALDNIDHFLPILTRPSLAYLLYKISRYPSIRNSVTEIGTFLDEELIPSRYSSCFFLFLCLGRRCSKGA